MDGILVPPFSFQGARKVVCDGSSMRGEGVCVADG